MDKFREIFQQCLQKHQASLGHNDSLFVQRAYRDGLQKYQDRIAAIGLTNKSKILDAGCGFGQWSLALATLNQAVSACDISAQRVDVLSDLAHSLAVSNLDIQTSSIDSLSYPDASFDAVFSYSVIFMTPWRQSLRELARVLKPGGTLYVNANGLGWYMFLWQEEPNKADDYDPKLIAARSFADTLRYDREGYYEPGMSLIIEPQQMQSELQQLGFGDIQIAHEGGLHLDTSYAVPKPFFAAEYAGHVAVYEVIARKRMI